jgi:hypothetical protein
MPMIKQILENIEVSSGTTNDFDLFRDVLDNKHPANIGFPDA